jgi:hypothetical protein
MFITIGIGRHHHQQRSCNEKTRTITELSIDYFMDKHLYYNRKWHISRDRSLIQWHLKILDNSTHIYKEDQVFLVAYI